MLACCEFFIKRNITGTFNVGFENLSVEKIAKNVKKIIPTKLRFKKVQFFKPEASRNESKETYLHCVTLKPL